jgi:hypothetical protein
VVLRPLDPLVTPQGTSTEGIEFGKTIEKPVSEWEDQQPHVMNIMGYHGIQRF